MATSMESPAIYDDSPTDQDDMVFPCKGCGEILEEGKAFELAGNRWHIDCFRCHSCGTLLDSDANLLLLGDGSLICNNCTYSCNACGNKIEDLAILTGDQAFCAGCFRCRSCKRKIDNLRYARTSQGIFCMSCHESLMARRRKKARAKPSSSAQSTAATDASTPASAVAAAAAAAPGVEKALPSLPPGAVHDGAFSPGTETPSAADSASGTPRNRSPGARSAHPRKAPSTNHLTRDASPLSDDARRAPVEETTTLPASTYKDGLTANSLLPTTSDDGEPEQGFLPMAFDPNPAPRIPQISRKRLPPSADASPQPRPEGQVPRDYFGGKPADRPRDYLREEISSSSRSASAERPHDSSQQTSSFPNPSQAKSSPHIAYQDKSRPPKRTTSGQNTPVSVHGHSQLSPAVLASTQDRSDRSKPQGQNGSSTLTGDEVFKLQDAPKARKGTSRDDSRATSRSPSAASPVDTATEADRDANNVSPVSQDSVNPFEDPKLTVAPSSAAPAPIPPRHADRPMRGDSLAATSNLKPSSKRTSPDPGTPTLNQPPPQPPPQPIQDQRHSVSSVHTPHSDAPVSISQESAPPSKAAESDIFRPNVDGPPPRASSRPSAAGNTDAKNTFISPRAPPTHPTSTLTSARHSGDPLSSGQPSPSIRSAALPQYTADGAFTMEKEMIRILRGERANEDAETSSSGLRKKVSNAAKHGRSFSDRGSNPKLTQNGVPDPSLDSPITISSPTVVSPTAVDSVETLRAQLRRAQQRIAELETDKLGLESKVNSSSEIKQMNSELKEKRTTMAFLDTQREIVVRELETMTHHLKTVKDQTKPLDLPVLKSNILDDFATSLQGLKDHVGTQIEDLMRKRNELIDEITSLIQMKDKGFQEFESLSTKNAQLMDMNNQLLQNIQDGFKANRSNSDGRANGLGIYHPGARVDTQGSSDLRNLNLVSTDSSMPNLLHETDAEHATVLTAPQVVNIRKGQPKKFNWRKGGERVAKGVTKGIKGAFANNDKPGIDITQIGMPYTSTHQAISGSEQSSILSRQGHASDKVAPGFGLFNQKNGRPGQLAGGRDYSASTLVAPADPSTLFGSDLEARCEFENRIIPGVVTRCIAEVEARGMRVEGIYRKSGGSGQVKSVQAGFEKDTNLDISDPDLEIHAVTSTLKQYFRKLPVPLITYDVYDSILDAGSVADKERQVIAMRQALAELPDAHRGCLEYLVRHLARVMKLEKDNLMTSLNLAVVFAPTIMRPLSIEREMSDGLLQRGAVQLLLEQHEEIFAA